MTLSDLDVVAYALPAPGWYEEVIELRRLFYNGYKEQKHIWVIEKQGAYLDKDIGGFAVRISVDLDFGTPEAALAYFEEWIKLCPDRRAYIAHMATFREEK